MPCTKGLWIWGKPVEIDQESVLIIMDTEGLNSVRNCFLNIERDINVDLKIFALSILLSSVFIYNSYLLLYQESDILTKKPCKTCRMC